LHGIKKFITINKKCFDSYERNGLLKLIDSYMGKILRKCANLTESIFIKYLIFNSIHTYEIERSSLNFNENDK